MSENNPWYIPKRIDELATPALLLFTDRVEHNIEALIEIAGSTDRLRPHVKTHKLPQVVAMHQAYGIAKLKCATIAEAEMVAECGIKDILLAYQPVGPNQGRLLALINAYPEAQFGCLVDNETVLHQLAATMKTAVSPLNVWIDIDNGNGRTGIPPSSSADHLAQLIEDTPTLNFAGLHIYDGHFAGLNFDQRKEASDLAFQPIREMLRRLEANGIPVKNIVAGGSPTFPVHTLREAVDLSPGTYIFWDAGYSTICPELPFLPAAVLVSRVISKPRHNRLCLDLGHKSVASENPLDKRVRFLNAPDAKFISQNEEHLVIELPNRDAFNIGDVLYGIPWHICPTVALHQEVIVVDESQTIQDRWPILARNRRLTI